MTNLRKSFGGRVCIITAMTKSGVIGKGNELPWNIPDELKNFRRLTQGSTVIMGKRTFESIGRPLPKRHNIILSPELFDITKFLNGQIPDGTTVDICESVNQALDKARSYNKDIFIIGGAYTYAQFLSIADYLYISYIKHNYDGDVFFPTLDLSQWEETERIDYPEFEFVVYKPKSS